MLMCTYMGGSWDWPNTDSEQGKSEWLAKGNLEQLPYKVIQITMRMRLSEFTRVYPQVLSSFPPHKHLTCFITLRLCGNSFSAEPKGQGLVTDSGLAARIQLSRFSDPTSIFGQEPKARFFQGVVPGCLAGLSSTWSPPSQETTFF